MVWEGDQPGIVQKIEILSFYQMVYTQANILENKTHKIFWDFEIWIDHLIPVGKPD